MDLESTVVTGMEASLGVRVALDRGGTVSESIWSIFSSGVEVAFTNLVNPEFLVASLGVVVMA